MALLVRANEGSFSIPNRPFEKRGHNCNTPLPSSPPVGCVFYCPISFLLDPLFSHPHQIFKYICNSGASGCKVVCHLYFLLSPYKKHLLFITGMKEPTPGLPAASSISSRAETQFLRGWSLTFTLGSCFL